MTRPTRMMRAHRPRTWNRRSCCTRGRRCWRRIASSGPARYLDKLGGATLDGMEICYLRIEDKARFRVVQSHYEKKTRRRTSFTSFPTASASRTLQTLAKEGRLRSINVLVTKANPKADRPPDEAEQLTVEILSVAIPAWEAGPGSGRRVEAEPSPAEMP